MSSRRALDFGPRDAAAIAQRLLANVETVVRGKSAEIRLVLAALASGGHVLLEDVPGTGKTVLAVRKIMMRRMEPTLPRVSR